jgi:hypothetical protein
MMIRLAIIFVFLAAAASPLAHADATDSNILHSTDGQFQLVVPKGWEAKDFHLETVQIGTVNKKLDEYAEVIAENRSDYTNSLQEYADGKRDTMAMSLDNPRLTAGEHVKVNGAEGFRYEIHGQIPNSKVSIGYTLTIFKSKSHYIQIVAWTQDSHFSERIVDLQNLAAGFSENSDAQK